MKSLVARIGQVFRRNTEKEPDHFDLRLKTLAAPPAPRRAAAPASGPVLFRRQMAAG